ncbi:hypothetical protein J437_LFUL000388 [Ladona fulva]|uniref:DNA-directed RNA polymerase III subunit RPC5 n=1 Tax=Ladona fulva TaxID=123851 RepID=A0A8K0K305_LADFU|nr:hypothetical protein J437_LFUL000388 [Ladona fulva]
MSDKDDDPVAPVFLSKTLAEKLYLYQYPVRPKHLKFDNSPVVNAKIKPCHQELELELALNTKSPNYNFSKGEQIALNAENSKEKGKQSQRYERGIMDRQILSSGPCALEKTCTYSIGIFQDGELHITPLKGIIQLQPSFSYLDLDRRSKEESKEADDGEVDEEEAQKITVKFARQESDRVKKARELSFGYISKKRAEEQWVPTNYFPSNSDESEQERSKMFCCLPQNEVTGLDIKTNDYLRNLVPPENSECSSVPRLPSNLISLDKLKTLPLGDQVKTLLQSAKVVQFEKLLYLLDQEKESANILRSLQAVAVVVNGNWVVKSDVIYPKDTESSINGVPADSMCRARDYVLFLFTKNQYLDRTEVINTVKLPQEEVTEILSQVSQHQKNKGWQFLLPKDEEFLKRQVQS